MADAKPVVPKDGEKITLTGGKLTVPDRPILPFIEGDGTGRDIWRASVRSSADTFGPRMNWVESRTPRTAASISSLSWRYCLRKSTMGIIV